MRKRGCSTEIKYKNQVCSSVFESKKNKKHLMSFFKNYPNTPSATLPRTPSFLVGFRRFSPVFAGFRRFPLVFPGYSPVFTGFRRCSPIFADFRRFSPVLQVFSPLSAGVLAQPATLGTIPVDTTKGCSSACKPYQKLNNTSVTRKSEILGLRLNIRLSSL